MATGRITERSAHSAFGSNEDWDLFYDGVLSQTFSFSLSVKIVKIGKMVFSVHSVFYAPRV